MRYSYDFNFHTVTFKFSFTSKKTDLQKKGKKNANFSLSDGTENTVQMVWLRYRMGKKKQARD